MNISKHNRKQASFRLSAATLEKLKQISEKRKHTGQNKSQGAIIDEAIENFNNGKTLDPKATKAWSKLERIGKRAGLSPEILLEHLLKKYKNISITVD